MERLWFPHLEKMSKGGRRPNALSDTQLAAVPKGTVVLLGQEFYADFDWWKWTLHEPYLVDGMSLHNGIRNGIGYRMLLYVRLEASV